MHGQQNIKICLFLVVVKIVQVQQYRSTSITACFIHTQWLHF